MPHAWDAPTEAAGAQVCVRVSMHVRAVAEAGKL
eukprot:CAMPEP_0119368650 /NCGR_PEP_ID=MMETSP1334-20130426/15281_1 /TAXON_ID=127549 /ORGANISM="Calcidiscus leptoporus, Strain RCC1130" /LENGTH=33 /DNA_ID= /DNA_START= /DNA_END= /DNA_ORIENTATION=